MHTSPPLLLVQQYKAHTSAHQHQDKVQIHTATIIHPTALEICTYIAIKWSYKEKRTILCSPSAFYYSILFVFCIYQPHSEWTRHTNSILRIQLRVWFHCTGIPAHKCNSVRWRFGLSPLFLHTCMRSKRYYFNVLFMRTQLQTATEQSIRKSTPNSAFDNSKWQQVHCRFGSYTHFESYVFQSLFMRTEMAIPDKFLWISGEISTN